MIRFREQTLIKREAEIREAEARGKMQAEQTISNHQLFYERSGIGEYTDKRKLVPCYAHAFINNIAFPKSLGELKEIFIDNHGRYNVEDILCEASVEWTAPRWAMVGDICLFMHAKGARADISRLKSHLRSAERYTAREKAMILEWLERGKALYDRFGGKIYAVAQVTGQPFYESDEYNENLHWKSRFYAQMGRIWLLDNPIDISSFNSFITVSRQGAITPLYGGDYDRLKEIIIESNPNPPRYFRDSIVGTIPLSRIDDENWLRLSYEYRYSYIHELQFRRYYVDFFLKALGDRKTIYSECRCVKPGVTELSRVDNVILFRGRYLPVEVKLSVLLETDLAGQVSKYCNDSVVFLDKEEKRRVSSDRFYNNHVLIIDRENLFLYDDRSGEITDLYDLDEIRNIGDISLFREKLAQILMREYLPVNRHRKI